mmetsp:Transcript_23337/g.78449  ORF Transcript_23337/g.78449 Transcript_23337/m.78449 type:complete len:220 (-) Transcript_23337:1912-2571(-)
MHLVHCPHALLRGHRAHALHGARAARRRARLERRSHALLQGADVLGDVLLDLGLAPGRIRRPEAPGDVHAARGASSSGSGAREVHAADRELLHRRLLRLRGHQAPVLGRLAEGAALELRVHLALEELRACDLEGGHVGWHAMIGRRGGVHPADHIPKDVPRVAHERRLGRREEAVEALEEKDGLALAVEGEPALARGEREHVRGPEARAGARRPRARLP